MPHAVQIVARRWQHQGHVGDAVSIKIAQGIGIVAASRPVAVELASLDMMQFDVVLGGGCGWNMQVGEVPAGQKRRPKTMYFHL